MKKIGNLDLYCGDKSNIEYAINNGMSILNALRNVSGYPCHKSVVMWDGKGCDKNHPEYLFAHRDNCLYLNLIDGNDPKYVPDEIVYEAINFIEVELNKGKKVFVCCSKGESRSPSLVFLYLLKNNYFSTNFPLEEFKLIFPLYNPATGIKMYVANEIYKHNEEHNDN